MRTLSLLILLSFCLALIGVDTGLSTAATAQPAVDQALAKQADDGEEDADADEAVTPGQALNDMLAWLRDHQSEVGNWNPAQMAEAGEAHGREGSYANASGGTDDGFPTWSDGITGLATAALLAAGHTHRDGEYAGTVRKAIRYLNAIQDGDGCFGPRRDSQFMQNHCFGTLAMGLAYLRSGAANLRGPTQAALNFIADAQNRRDETFSGWRYGVRPGDSDTTVTGWAALACLIAKRGDDIDVPDHIMEGANAWLDNMAQEVDGSWRVGYITRGGQNARLQQRVRWSPNLENAALALALWRLGRREGIDSRLANIAWQLVAADNLPRSTPVTDIDLMYWFWGTLAMRSVGGPLWQRWRQAVSNIVMGLQIRGDEPTDARFGSIDTDTAWGAAGGRIYTTAMGALILGMCWNGGLERDQPEMLPLDLTFADRPDDGSPWMRILTRIWEEEYLPHDHPGYLTFGPADFAATIEEGRARRTLRSRLRRIARGESDAVEAMVDTLRELLDD